VRGQLTHCHIRQASGISAISLARGHASAIFF
jgi:hypothetical protein